MNAASFSTWENVWNICNWHSEEKQFTSLNQTNKNWRKGCIFSALHCLAQTISAGGNCLWYINSSVSVHKDMKRSWSQVVGLTFPPHKSDFKDFKMKQNFWKFFSCPFCHSGKEKKKGDRDSTDSLNQQIIQWLEHLLEYLRDQFFIFSLQKLLEEFENTFFSLTGAACAHWAVSCSGVCYSHVLLQLCHII